MDYHEKIKYVEKMFGNKINDKNKKYFYRFWEKVDIKEDINECWNWIAHIESNGYGRFRIGIDMIGTHRLSYILTKESIPEGLQVQHSCNNRRCCNPHHLELGNQSKNVIYSIKCNRWNKNGENSSFSILTNDQIREIHKLYNEQRRQHPEFKQWQITEPIGKKFEISRIHVNEIIAGRHWHHIFKEFHNE